MKRYQEVWLEQIDQLIDNNLSNPDFQLLDITRALKISRAKLYRDIMKLTGNSSSKYILKRRLERAKEILEIGIYPSVKETAMKVGFRKQDYFTKVFYKEYAILPSEILKCKTE